MIDRDDAIKALDEYILRNKVEHSGDGPFFGAKWVLLLVIVALCVAIGACVYALAPAWVVVAVVALAAALGFAALAALCMAADSYTACVLAKWERRS